MAKIYGRTLTTPPPKKLSKYENDKKYVSESDILNNYYDKEDIDLKVDELSEEIEDLKNNGTGGSGNVDLSNYYTKEEIDEALKNVSGSPSGVSLKLTNLSDFIATSIAKEETVEVSFKFESTDDGVATGDGSLSVIVNGVNKLTKNISQGEHTINVTEYLSLGDNTVQIKCTDVYGNYKLLSYSIAVIDLYVTSTFDDSLAYDGIIQLKYTPYGAIEKTVHILIDGEEKHTTTTTSSGRQTTVNFDKLSHGIHKFDVFVTASLNESDLESEHLIYDVICIENGKTDVLISSVYEVTTAKQGTQVSIPYIVYNPTSLTSDISLVISNENGVYSTQDITVNRSRQHWNVRDYPVGNTTFTIKCGDVEKTHALTVTEAEFDVEAVTNDLELYLTSKGRSNNEQFPFIWTYGDVTTTFNNVNWDSTGWVEDENGDTVLRLNGGATAEISFQPFKDDFKTYGKTIEMEFTIRDVNNREAEVISCIADGIGFEMTCDTARLKSELSEISCNYFENDKVRVSFVVESKNEYRLLLVYLNGVLSGAKQYPANDNFQQTTPINITIGSPYCGIDVYTIRSYSNALTFNEVIDNYIADIQDIVEKSEVYEDNNIYDEYSNLKYDLVKEKIPVMTIIGSLPQSKGDKKDVVVKFEHNTDDSLSFVDTASIDVQGTSSQWYIRKNYKEKLSEAHLHAKGQMPSRVFCTKADYAESTGTHNTQNANLVETLYSEKTPAQLVDDRCRTTIYGYPIVMYHQATETSEPVFIGKYNFNFDKGSEEVYGFDGSFDVESWEFKNNTSDQCNFLATIGTTWEDDFEARYPENNTNISRFKRMHTWVVSTKNNLTKFKNEFETYFDLHYMLIYYVYSSVMLMVDQRAKNMFLTYWAKTGKWQAWFYDNDTSCGINNEGHLVFDYFHEDIDIVNGANVYNGQNSTLWNNFRQAYAEEIKKCYQDLRNNGKLTYDKVIEYFVTNGSDKWSASIYNEDSDYKYISMLRSDNDATNLYQIRGNGEEHLKYFISNRLKYLDSKWYASDYAENYATLRIYTPSEYAGVTPNANITITPFSHMYAGVRYKANGTLEQKRVSANEVTTFEAPNETFNDTETAIYGASEISSLGDLAPLYCGTVNVSKASRLIELKIGDGTEGYVNTNLKTLSVGTNRLLKKIDVRNCPNLVDPLALSGCPNIEEIYATGSGITGLELPTSGYLKVVHLPKVSNLTLKNQLYIDDLQVEGYENVSTLNIENCPTLDEADILRQCTNIKRVRLTDVDWSFNNASFLFELIDRGIKGVDENGLNVDIPQISGTCHIETLSGSDMADLNAYFPYLTITYDSLSATMIYMNEDGTEELYRETILNGGDSTYGGTTPTKEDTAQFDYEFIGWSSEIGGEADENITKNVTTNRTVYAVFSATLRQYTITFSSEGTVLQSSLWNYGEMPTYNGEEPTKAEHSFIGWTPTISEVVGNADYQAKFKSTQSYTRKFVDRSIENVYNDNATSTRPYCFFQCKSLKNVTLPNVITIANQTFINCGNLTTVDLASATSIGDQVFSSCPKITTLILRSDTLCTIYPYAIGNNSLEPFRKGTAHAYVPRTLLDAYKSNGNWSLYANQIRAIEDYPEICGGV